MQLQETKYTLICSYLQTFITFLFWLQGPRLTALHSELQESLRIPELRLGRENLLARREYAQLKLW